VWKRNGMILISVLLENDMEKGDSATRKRRPVPSMRPGEIATML
jgi:hypothetical protein